MQGTHLREEPQYLGNMAPSRLEDTNPKKSLSLKSLRLLHRYFDDFVLLHRAKSGTLPPAELSRLLRMAGADDQEIQMIMNEYRRD